MANAGFMMDCDGHPILSPRDYFAGQALSELVSLISVKHAEATARVIAELSYKVADAMLAARGGEASE